MSPATRFWLLNKLLDESTSDVHALMLIYAARQGATIENMVAMETPSPANPDMKTDDMGVIGNVWVRQQYYPNKDKFHEGHKHHHDHVSLLATGRLMVKVEGHDPVIYQAPTFFKIAAEHKHQLIPLEDETVAYCVFALRDDNDQVVDEFDGNTQHYGANHDS